MKTNVAPSAKRQGGFTIIEVVLVLAIAGLIFLVVFLALPALQRSQRDTQRKSDLGRFMSQLNNYQSNHQGTLPTGTGAGAWTTAFTTPYLTSNGQTFNDPQSGSTYTVTVINTLPGTAPTVATGNISVYINAKCDSTATSGLSAGSGNRSVAALMGVEQGGTYCESN